MIQRIGPFSFEDYVNRVREFHGFSAPGVVLGGVMVDLALKHLPSGILYDALCETDKCLPDAIQLLTPCTVGNGWLKVKPWGRFALALYDKQTGNGIRVGLNPERIDEWPEIKTWYYKLKPKGETDQTRLIDSIQESGYAICRFQEIQVQPGLLGKASRGARIDCAQCGESFPADGNGTCPACRGGSDQVYRGK